MSGEMFRPALVLLSLVLCTLGCQDRSQAPAVASSAEQPGYATRFPERLDGVRTRLVEAREQVANTARELQGFPDALGETDWKLVAQVYESADEEGRSAAYAERHEETLSVQRFFEEEKRPLVARAAGGAQHHAKEKGCDVQLHGPIAVSLERGVEQQLLDRKRADSTAQLTIEEHQDALGKKNVSVLRTQADQLSLASHWAHVRIRNDELELAQLVDDTNQIRKTLEARAEHLESSKSRNSQGHKEELAQVKSALANLDQTSQSAREALQDAEERGKKLEDDYSAAFSALIDEVERRAKQAGSN